MKYTPWTNKEIARLKQLYPVSSPDELVREFHPRAIYSIKSRAASLGLRKRGHRWEAIAKAHSPLFHFPTSLAVK